MDAPDIAEKIIETPIEGTPYRIVDKGGYRSLMAKNNDASAHSQMLLSAPDVLAVPYTRFMLRALPFAPRLDDILLIGLGGGQQAKFLYRHLPATRLMAVEIDPHVVGIARSYFSLPPDDDRLSVVVGDGKDYIEAHPDCCDVLLCDGYDRTFNVPDSLSGENFYRACYRALRPGGVMAVNFDRRSDDWLTAHRRLLRRVFSLRMDLSVMEGQLVVLLFKDEPDEDYTALKQRAQALEERMELGLPAFVGRFIERLEHVYHEVAALNNGNR